MSTIHQGDCLDILKSMETDSVDLVVTSPPYEDARTYGIDFGKRNRLRVPPKRMRRKTQTPPPLPNLRPPMAIP